MSVYSIVLQLELHTSCRDVSFDISASAIQRECYRNGSNTYVVYFIVPLQYAPRFRVSPSDFSRILPARNLPDLGYMYVHSSSSAPAWNILQRALAAPSCGAMISRLFSELQPRSFELFRIWLKHGGTYASTSTALTQSQISTHRDLRRGETNTTMWSEEDGVKHPGESDSREIIFLFCEIGISSPASLYSRQTSIHKFETIPKHFPYPDTFTPHILPCRHLEIHEIEAFCAAKETSRVDLPNTTGFLQID